eukprot:2253690-Rhodomonas_salina.1
MAAIASMRRCEHEVQGQRTRKRIEQSERRSSRGRAEQEEEEGRERERIDRVQGAGHQRVFRVARASWLVIGFFASGSGTKRGTDVQSGEAERRSRGLSRGSGGGWGGRGGRGAERDEGCGVVRSITVLEQQGAEGRRQTGGEALGNSGGILELGEHSGGVME